MVKAFTGEEVLDRARESNVKFIRLQFTDILGAFKNIAITVEELERALDGQVMFDSSVVEGFVGNKESDIYLKPDPGTFEIFPWRPRDGAVARLICDILAPGGEPFGGCSRSALKRAGGEAAAKGYQLRVGAEIEFFLFHTDDQGKPSTVTHDRAGYCDLSPVDLGENARRDMVLTLEEMGFDISSSHHEIAPGQHASFMPKPLSGLNGSGMHLHQSLWQEGLNAFDNPAGAHGLSDEAAFYIGGLLRHARAMAAVANPLVNSYKRLLPNELSPVLVAWSELNRSTVIRVPSQRGDGARIVLRNPDPAANPYLLLAANLKAGLAGIAEKAAPPPLVAENHLGPADLRRLLQREGLPRSLGEALQHLAADQEIQASLGAHIAGRFLKAKGEEWERFQAEVHRWELDEYLTNY